MNFCLWYSVISRFFIRPNVAHLPPPIPYPLVLKLFFKLGFAVVIYGHISEAAAMAIAAEAAAAASPLLSLFSLSALVSKPFLEAGVSVVNGGTGGCFL